MKFKILLSLFIILTCSLARGQELRKPDIVDASYGPYELNKFDLWKAESNKPTPLVVHIHGGGFTSGSKEKVPNKMVLSLLEEGISIMSINYRLTPDVVFPQHFMDCVRAIQFARYNAHQLNIDVTKIAASGSSAGACAALWIALNDDLADNQNIDPVLRMSSRLNCVAISSGQTTLDHRVIKEIIGEIALRHSFMKGNFFGLSTDSMNTHRAYHLFKLASPITYLSYDDPPVWASYSFIEKPTSVSEAIHHINFGVLLKEKMDELGLECILRKPNDVKSITNDSVQFLKKHLY